MTKEIERKFLIDRKKAFTFVNSKKATKLEIEQFYISLEPEFRFRRTISDSETTYVKAEKSQPALERIEIETESSMTEYENLIIASSLVINKRRYVIDGMEFDFYPDGLAIMEKEYSSIKEAKEDHLNFDFIQKEVTGDKYYSNAQIALRNSKRA